MTETLPQRLRMWAYGNLVIGGLEGFASNLGRLPMNDPERHGVRVVRDVAYRHGGNPMHRLDIYRPVGSSGPTPVAIYVHGGGFKYFDKRTHWAVAMTLARRGMVVFNVNYRLAPAHPFPAAAQDVSDAMVWVTKNAEAWGGDLSRMVWAGESAGGNLVLGLAIAASWRREEPWARAVWETGVQAKVLLPACGYLQVSRPERHAEERSMPAWMNDRIVQVSDAWLPNHAAADPANALADPLLVLEGAAAPERPFPATFAVVGDRDPVMGDTLRLGESLKKLGVPSESRVYPGGIHAFHAFTAAKLARRAWNDQLAFVDQHIAF